MSNFMPSAPFRPYFLLGVQGSGTNLTGRILESVFEFSGVLDNSVIFKAAVEVHRDPSRKNIVKQFKQIHRKFFPGAIRRRLSYRNYHHRGIGFKGIEESFDPDQIHGGADFARFYYSYLATAQGRKEVFVKSDDLWEDIEHLEGFFPERRCVLLIRDPRDNALSISRKDFGPRDLYVAAKLVDHQLNLYRKVADSRPENCVTVKYESLLEDPLAFLSDFSNRFGFEIPADAEARIDRLNIRKENFDKWRQLPAEDIAACEWVLAAHLRDFGYSLSGMSLQPPSGSAIVGRHLKDAVMRVPQKCQRILQAATER